MVSLGQRVDYFDSTDNEENLDIKDLDIIMREMKNSGFSDYNWVKLGLYLGLYYNTLQIIEANYQHVSRCLMECLSKWLRNGGATKTALVQALVDVEEQAAADHISKLTIHKIISCYFSALF